MNIAKAAFRDIESDTDWFKGFAANLLHQLADMTKDQLAIYCVIVLVIGADEAPHDAVMWRRKLRAYTGLGEHQLEIELTDLAALGKINISKDGIISLRAAP